MSWEPLRDDPDELGGYRLSGRLGAGGMGRVYLAFTSAGRPVALKVLRPELGDDPEFRERFRQEITAAQRVSGLYTAQVLDADPAGSPPWLVTAYVPGPSLAQAVSSQGPWPEQNVLLLVAGVAEALQAIHAAGLVHRDLKPSNVLLAADGPRVIDFGIARAVQEPGLTRTGMLMGSPQFISPEQAWGTAVTSAADVFALGGLAAYTATGRPPFGTGEATAVLYRVMHHDPDLGGCPGPLLAVIGPCLAKDPTARPTPTQVIERCRELMPSGTLVFTPSWLPPAIAADLASHAAPGPPAAPHPQVAPAGRPAYSEDQPAWPRTLLETGRSQATAGPQGTARLPGDGSPPATTVAYGSGMPPGTAVLPRRRRMSGAVLAALVAAGVLVSAVAVVGLATLLHRPSPSASSAGALDSCLFGTWVMRSETNQLSDGQWETYTGGGGTWTFQPSGMTRIDYGDGSPQSVTVNGVTWTYVWVGGYSGRYTASDGTLRLHDMSGITSETELENGSYYSKSSGPLTPNPGAQPYTCSAQTLRLSPNGGYTDGFTDVLTKKS